MVNESIPTGAPQSEEEIIGELRGEAERLSQVEAEKLAADQGAVSQISQEVARREEAERIAAERMADDPQYARSAAELMENVKDPMARRSLLILYALTPNTPQYNQALEEVPEHFRKIANNVMPATQNIKEEKERKLCDWIFFENASLSEGKTGIDINSISDELFQERMTALRMIDQIRPTRYVSQEEFGRKLSEKIRNIRIKRAFAELRKKRQ